MTDKGKKILIVEDEQDARRYLSTLLQDNGYTTILAKGGNEGMELVRKEKPDLITLDINMPEGTGTRMLRNLTDDPDAANIPVVIVSVVDPELEDFLGKMKCVNSPAAFFEKPIDREEFLIELKKIMD
ncbi:response regulator [Planctomycetota bacterium]